MIVSSILFVICAVGAVWFSLAALCRILGLGKIPLTDLQRLVSCLIASGIATLFALGAMHFWPHAF